MGKKTASNVKSQPTAMSWFDKLSTGKKEIVCILALYILILILFNKIIFNDMIFSESGDSAASMSWVKAADHLKSQGIDDPIWFPYVFSGMPAFGSLAYTPRDVNYFQKIIHFFGRILFLNGKMSWVVLHYFLAGIFMFLLLRYLKFSHLPALLGAITFMLNPYAIGLAETGHGSKLIALSYIPLLFLLTHILFERRNILSLGLLAAAIGTQLLSNHVQMVFYSFLIIGTYYIYQMVVDARNEPRVIPKKTIFILLAFIVGFAISSYVYLSVQEYSHYSIRGSGSGEVKGGLNYDYATNWSFHPFEMINYLIPSFFGFSSNYVTDFQGQQVALPLYWGWMPFTDSTLYIGLVPLFLGIIGLIFKRNRISVYLLLLSLFVFLIAFGRHLPLLYDLMFNYFPFFNKFRVPAMILHLVPFIFGILSAKGLSFLLSLNEKGAEFDQAKFKKRLLYIIGLLGGLLIIGLIGKGAIYSFLSDFMFVKEGDAQQYGYQVLNVLKEKRFDILWNDYIKFSILSVIFFGSVYIYLNRKIKQTGFAFILILLLLADLYVLDIRYISPKPQTAIEEHFQPDAAVQFLQSDPSLYRVYPIGQLFMDNTYMYHFIQSIGGYSPAKLRIYQEMIDSIGLHPPRFPLNMNVLNMLNVKYIIAAGRLPNTDLPIVTVDQTKQLLVYQCPGVLPRAYFTDTAVVASKDKIYSIMNSPGWNPKTTAILENELPRRIFKSDSSRIEMTSYGGQDIKLEAYNSDMSLLVLSEPYYPAGWKAYIDGNETEIYKTNYVLRSIIVPPGVHKIEFKFDSPIYHLGFTVSQISWGITVVIILVGILQLPFARRKFANKEKAA